jgi:hypothetical protein
VLLRKIRGLQGVSSRKAVIYYIIIIRLSMITRLSMRMWSAGGIQP